jgi:hypothetical protein
VRAAGVGRTLLSDAFEVVFLFIHVIRDQHGLDEGKLALTKRFWFQKKAARKLLRAAFATLDRFVTAARGQAKRWFLGAIYA